MLLLHYILFFLGSGYIIKSFHVSARRQDVVLQGWQIAKYSLLSLFWGVRQKSGAWPKLMMSSRHLCKCTRCFKAALESERSWDSWVDISPTYLVFVCVYEFGDCTVGHCVYAGSGLRASPPAFPGKYILWLLIWIYRQWKLLLAAAQFQDARLPSLLRGLLV